MSTKELVLKTVRDLPDDATWSEIEERLRFLSAIESSRQEVRDGKFVAHEEVRDLLIIRQCIVKFTKNLKFTKWRILMGLCFLLILIFVFKLNNPKLDLSTKNNDTIAATRVVEHENSNVTETKHKEADDGAEVSVDKSQQQHAVDVIHKYLKHEANISEVLEALESVEDMRAQHSLWPRFVDKARFEDYEKILEHLVSKTNASVASSAIHNMAINAVRADEVDLDKLCKLIPEGQLRATALEAILATGSEYFAKWKSVIIATEHNLEGDHLDSVVFPDHSLHGCTNSQLIELHEAFSGPGKSAMSYILHKRAKSKDISTVNDFMIASNYPKKIFREVLDDKLSKYPKDKLLAYDENSIPGQGSDQFIAAVASRIDAISNRGASIDWLVSRTSYSNGQMAFDERVKHGLGLSPDAVAEKVVHIADDNYRNRGYYLLAEFLSRPEEKEIRTKWINAISDEKLKSEAMSKFNK